jgi:hypothetical protein
MYETEARQKLGKTGIETFNMTNKMTKTNTSQTKKV